MTTDPRDWLERLSAAEWIAAAENEIEHCRRALESRSYRAGVTHARRSAGMACNAVLRLAFNPAWGRSYMDHIFALADDPDAPARVRASARLLVDTRPVPPELVTLGKPDLSTLTAANEIISWAQEKVQAAQAEPSLN